MYRIGVSGGASEETFRRMQEAGISATEISLAPEMYKVLDHKEVAGLAQKYGIELWSYHLPFQPFSEIRINLMIQLVLRKTGSEWRNVKHIVPCQDRLDIFHRRAVMLHRVF